MKKTINYLNEAIKKEKYLLLFIIIIFIVGVIFGSLFVNFITESDKKLLINQVGDYFLEIKNLSKDVFGINFFKEEVISNIIRLVITFILGISVIGILAVIFIIFYKGFMLGTTISSILLKYKLKGVLVSILYIFPMQVLNIIVYLFLSFFAVSTSIKLIKALIRKDNLNFKKFFGKYLLSLIVSIILITLISLIDSYLTPFLLKLLTFIL